MEVVKYQVGDFARFVKKFKTIKRSSYTHTSFQKPAGSFFIPTDQMPMFYALYRCAMKCGEDLHVTEKHIDISPVLIDLDFRYRNDSCLDHRHNADDLELIIMTYLDALNKYVEFEKATIYVMEKPQAVVKNNVIRDGLHMVITDIVTRPAVQHLVRRDVLQPLSDIFRRLEPLNDIESIVDEAVIETNPWMMYGSRKPEGEAYAITHIYESVGGNLKERSKKQKEEDYVEALSIRNKYRENPLKIEMREEVETFEVKMFADREKKRQIQQVTQKCRNTSRHEYPYIDTINKLVDILSPRRAESYNDWIRVGWCLRNIDNRLLDTWIGFSRKSPKFEEGACENLWDHMREGGLGIGTLHMWAKQDNEKAYADLISSDLFELIKESMNKSHYDIAKVVHRMFEHEFVCVSVKSKQWCYFRNHRWRNSDSGVDLRNKISDEVFKEYTKASMHYQNLCLNAGTEEQQIYAANAKKLTDIGLLLKSTPFKDNIMKECANMFYVPHFEDRLDSQTHLIGFENGVLDLETMEFREGRPEDYISFSTGINYREFNENDPTNNEIMGFLSKVLTKDDVREYVMKVLASCLDGSVREEKFYIWTGVGANGKSKLLELVMKTLGEYYCIMNVTAITGKRVSSNATNSELVQTKGRRAVVMQEPGEDEKMNIGYMKELTGGDLIKGRGLFKEPIEFKPQFKMILTCNHLPAVPSASDNGTWRRIRLVEFTSRFVENPDPSKQGEFMIDRELSTKFEAWKEAFMSILVEYYKKYRDEGISEPEDVMKCTKEYRKNNDVLSEFYDDMVEQVQTGFIGLIEMYEAFKEWLKRTNPSLKMPRRKEVQSHFERTIGKMGKTPRAGWAGYALKSMALADGDIDADD